MIGRTNAVSGGGGGGVEINGTIENLKVGGSTAINKGDFVTYIPPASGELGTANENITSATINQGFFMQFLSNTVGIALSGNTRAFSITVNSDGTHTIGAIQTWSGAGNALNLVKLRGNKIAKLGYSGISIGDFANVDGATFTNATVPNYYYPYSIEQIDDTHVLMVSSYQSTGTDYIYIGTLTSSGLTFNSPLTLSSHSQNKYAYSTAIKYIGNNKAIATYCNGNTFDQFACVITISDDFTTLTASGAIPLNVTISYPRRTNIIMVGTKAIVSMSTPTLKLTAIDCSTDTLSIFAQVATTDNIVMQSMLGAYGQNCFVCTYNVSGDKAYCRICELTNDGITIGTPIELADVDYYSNSITIGSNVNSAGILGFAYAQPTTTTDAQTAINTYKFPNMTGTVIPITSNLDTIYGVSNTNTAVEGTAEIYIPNV